MEIKITTEGDHPIDGRKVFDAMARVGYYVERVWIDGEMAYEHDTESIFNSKKETNV